MEIYRLLRMYKLNIYQFIEMIKKRGEVIIHDPVGIPYDKYIERALLIHDNSYYVTYMVLDNYMEECYWEDIEVFTTEIEARAFYNQLAEYQN